MAVLVANWKLQLALQDTIGYVEEPDIDAFQ